MSESYRLIAGRLTVAKGYGEELDYSLDLTDWLGSTGDALLTTTWRLSPGLVNLRPDPTPTTPTTSTVWLGGGTLGTNEWATCDITTAQGRVCQQTIHLHIVHQ